MSRQRVAAALEAPMKDELVSVREDLAFMRGVVEAGSRSQMLGGAGFLAGGLIYGAQCLVQWAAVAGVFVVPGALSWQMSLGPTVLFLIVLGWILWNGQGVSLGQAQKAVTAAFAAAGLTNLAMIVVFATIATKLRQPLLWEIYPIVVFALQGAAWLTAFGLWRRLWHLLVALGWFASAIGMAFLFGTADFVLLAGMALIVLMAVPGAALMRLARRSA
jgi:hypothetical protein